MAFASKKKGSPAVAPLPKGKQHSQPTGNNPKGQPGKSGTVKGSDAPAGKSTKKGGM